jgi:hypothetical protein
MGDILSDPARTTSLFTEAIAATQRSGDHARAGVLTNNAGVYALLAEDLPAARAYLGQAAEAFRAMGDEDTFEPINMGWVLRQDHDPVGARASFQAALRNSVGNESPTVPNPSWLGKGKAARQTANCHSR